MIARGAITLSHQARDGGTVYGFLAGLGFVMLGWLASGLLAFVLGRILGRPLLRAALGGRFTSLEGAI